MVQLRLPDPLAATLAPLLAELPIAEAMSGLVVASPADSGVVDLIHEVVGQPDIGEPLSTGLWLYVDDLDRSHRISQSLDDETGSFWHGIMHRREGDFSNSHYWFRRVGYHPAMDLIDGYDSHAFIDQVEQAYRTGHGLSELIDLQRREWAALFGWCAEQV